MKLSVITDEVTQNIYKAVEFAKRHGISGVELRTLDNRALDDFSRSEIYDIKGILSSADLDVCCLASPVFKCSLHDDSEYSRHIERLAKFVEYARILDCPFVRGFSFNREEPVDFRIIARRFEPVKALFDKSGLMMLLEADPGVYATNCKKLASLLDLIDSPFIGAIYDPGNCIYDPDYEVPYPDGYNSLKRYIKHVHIKDAVVKDGMPMAVKVGIGDVPYHDILTALKGDSYDGYLSLETHYRHRREISGELLHMPGGEAFSMGGEAASDESMEAFLKISAGVVWPRK